MNTKKVDTKKVKSSKVSTKKVSTKKNIRKTTANKLNTKKRSMPLGGFFGTNKINGGPNMSLVRKPSIFNKASQFTSSVVNKGITNISNYMNKNSIDYNRCLAIARARKNPSSGSWNGY